MFSYRFILSTLILGALSSCATAPPVNDATPANDPRSLAQEQWDNCSHFPSVELVEITSAGQLIVRDKQHSFPRLAYSRCVISVAAKQVFDGRRDPRDIVRYAYFTNKPPPRGSISVIAGQLPVWANQFDPEQGVTFFYALMGLNERVKVTLVWHTPQGGVYSSTTQFVGPTGPNARWTWRTKRIALPKGRPGSWSVQMFIQGLPAGEYQFQVLKPKT